MGILDDYLYKLYIQECLYNTQNVLNKSAFPNALIKGIALSNQIYGNTWSRRCTDFDILISRYNITQMEQLLYEYGFESKSKKHKNKITFLSTSHQVAPWIKEIPPWGTIVVDLNFDIFWGEYEGKRIDIEYFLSDTIEMEIYGVKVNTLPPIKALIQLILHHYKDMNSIFLLATRKSIKYDMFKDVYYLLKNNLDTIPLDKFYAISAEYEIVPYVFYVLYYTGQIFVDDILKQYIETFRTPEGEALLNCYGLCSKERKEWKYDFQTRLEAENLHELIKNDLTEKDHEKIRFNTSIFGG